ncbi:MAG: hypothetical protein LIO38_08385 [Cloacibacillus sp.]|nr:hypothetical protein [Cloacibacillus sp.]
MRKRLSAAGFETAGGQGALKGKLIRAAHYSDWEMPEMEDILRAFAEAIGNNCDDRYLETARNIFENR